MNVCILITEKGLVYYAWKIVLDQQADVVKKVVARLDGTLALKERAASVRNRTTTGKGQPSDPKVPLELAVQGSGSGGRGETQLSASYLALKYGAFIVFFLVTSIHHDLVDLAHRTFFKNKKIHQEADNNRQRKR